MEYVLYGKYGKNKWERIDSAETKESIYYLLGEYRLAFGPGWQYKIKKEKKTDES